MWITRSTWRSVIARIVEVGQPKGPPPYFGNPQVLADIYNLDGSVREHRAIVAVPGTYKTYSEIDPPSWA